MEKIIKVYLKTIFSTPSEIKYLKLNIQEAFDYIDKMIVCEYNYTHTGEKRELIFENFLDEFSDEEKSKIIYIGADISSYIKYAINNESVAHENEKLMRGYFVKEVTINNDDIVFSVDADEVIFSEYYPELIAKLNDAHWPWQKKSYRLPIRQFFYKINYHWTNLKIIAPVACKASYFLKQEFPAQWRDDGKVYSKYVGSHYSWCISIEEMVQKIRNYAHQEQYAHLAEYETMKSAVENKEYPFDKNREFDIKVIDLSHDRKLFPKSMYKNLDLFDTLMSK